MSGREPQASDKISVEELLEIILVLVGDGDATDVKPVKSVLF